MCRLSVGFLGKYWWGIDLDGLHLLRVWFQFDRFNFDSPPIFFKDCVEDSDEFLIDGFPELILLV